MLDRLGMGRQTGFVALFSTDEGRSEADYRSGLGGILSHLWPFDVQLTTAMGFLIVVARVSKHGLLDASRAFDLVDALKTVAGEMLKEGCYLGYCYEEQLLTDWIEPKSSHPPCYG